MDRLITKQPTEQTELIMVAVKILANAYKKNPIIELEYAMERLLKIKYNLEHNSNHFEVD